MENSTLDRRGFLRGATAGVAAASGVTLAGCSGPGEDDEDGDDGGVYREEAVDPQAGISAGGSSAG